MECPHHQAIDASTAVGSSANVPEPNGSSPPGRHRQPPLRGPVDFSADGTKIYSARIADSEAGAKFCAARRTKWHETISYLYSVLASASDRIAAMSSGTISS
jgi:hypothetical protein